MASTHRQRLAAPVLLLDLFDLLFAHPEVVSELVDHRLGHAVADLLVVLARLLDRPLIDRDAVGERVAVAPAAFGERRALIETEQRVRRARSPISSRISRRRLVFDDDGDVLHRVAEAARDLAQRLFDERGEPFVESSLRAGTASRAFADRMDALRRRLTLREPMPAGQKSQSLPHGAAIAERPRLADAAAVQDERVGGARPVRRRQRRAQLLLDDLRIVRPGDADAVGDAQHVTIDRQARHAERVAEDDVRGLAADAGQLDERLHRRSAPRRRGVRRARSPCRASDRDLARKKPVDWICGSSSSVDARASARASG